MRRPLILALAVSLVFGSAAASAEADTVTFGFTGTEQMFIVPPGVTSINVRAVGAHGGRGEQDFTSPPRLGGAGAVATADLAVTPGQVLFVEVGGHGQDGDVGLSASLGGFNGGGNGSPGVDGSGASGGGGGATDVRTVARSAGNSLAARLIVAGGGGGSGAQGEIEAGLAGAGGAASQDGQDGDDTGANGGVAGKGATATAGGASGAGGAAGSAAGSPGTAGELGAGGRGGGGAGGGGGSGGGGGGGLFGGGGGGGGAVSGGTAPGAGGGGGSSGFGAGTSNSGIAAAAFTDPPIVTIGYTAPPETTLTDKPKSKLRLKGGRKVRAEFAFTSSTAGATFQCGIDKGDFEACTSPASYSLKKGKHSFAVRAVSAGVTDPTPETFDFKVKGKPKHGQH